MEKLKVAKLEAALWGLLVETQGETITKDELRQILYIYDGIE